MKKKWLEDPIVIILLCILIFPLGLIVLGSNPNIKWLSKLLVSLTYIIMILIFFNFYQLTVRNSNSPSIPATTDQITYEIGNCYSVGMLKNGLSMDIKPTENEIFFCIDIKVQNQGQSKVFYVSLIDDPKLITDKTEYSPDLSISQEPFGEIQPKQVSKGFLAFRIQKDEKILQFRIGKIVKNINQ